MDEDRDGPPKRAVEPADQPQAGFSLKSSTDGAPVQSGIERVALFVDGFNLYHGLHEKFRRQYLWLDLWTLGERLLKPAQELVSVRYFTARVRNDPQGAARQVEYLGALEERGVEIVEGRFQEKNKTCRRCQAQWRSYEEKESDVNLCVSLMSAAFANQFDVALILSADGDMIPAIKAVKELNPTLRMIAAFPPARSSEALKRAVDGHLYVGRDKIRGSQFPDSYQGHQRIFNRPSHWK